MSAHTAEPWTEFNNHPGKTPYGIMLTYRDYDRAKLCVDACAGVPDNHLIEATKEGGVTILKTIVLKELVRRARERDSLLAEMADVIQRDVLLAPEQRALLEAAKRLQARGFFNPSTCADDETNADMAALVTAIQRVEGALHEPTKH